MSLRRTDFCPNAAGTPASPKQTGARYNTKRKYLHPWLELTGLYSCRYLLSSVASSDGGPQQDVAQLQQPSRQTSRPEGALLLVAVSRARPGGPHRESGERGVKAVRGPLRAGVGRVAVVDGTRQGVELLQRDAEPNPAQSGGEKVPARHADDTANRTGC